MTYEIHGEFARGDSSAIMLATDDTGQRVAIKVGLDPCGTPASDAWVRNHSNVANLQCKHAIGVKACVRVGERMAFELELAVANVLDHYASKKLEAHRLLNIIRSIADGLDEMHSSGLVHGNVNPSHILIDKAQGARLCGFGASMLLADESGDTRVVPTCVAYSAPEARDGILVGASDQWALAHTFVEIRDSVGVEFSAAEIAAQRLALDVALAEDPDLRFRTCRAFSERLSSDHDPF